MVALKMRIKETGSQTYLKKRKMVVPKKETGQKIYSVT